MIQKKKEVRMFLTGDQLNFEIVVVIFNEKFIFIERPSLLAVLLSFADYRKRPCISRIHR